MYKVGTLVKHQESFLCGMIRVVFCKAVAIKVCQQFVQFFAVGKRISESEVLQLLNDGALRKAELG